MKHGETNIEQAKKQTRKRANKQTTTAARTSLPERMCQAKQIANKQTNKTNKPASKQTANKQTNKQKTNKQ